MALGLADAGRCVSVRSTVLEPGTRLFGAPGAAPLEVRGSDPNQVLAVWRNVAVALWVRETQLTAVAAIGAVLAELTSGGRRAALLQIADLGATFPSAEAREAITLLLKRHSSSLLASAVVFEAEGFKGAAARAVVSGIALMSRLPYPHEIFASVPAALDWIDRRQPQPGNHRRDQVERAIAQLHERAR